MKKATYWGIFLLLACAFLLQAQSPPSLFPIVNNQHYGFINAKGKVVIKPQFRAVGAFSEGLAPARLEGHYGFINQKGALVIPAEYDYAESFRYGLAKVYKKDQSFFINNRGETAFLHNYKKVGDFNEYGVAVVMKESRKYGIINQKGEAVLEANYYSIGAFQGRLAVVRKVETKQSQYYYQSAQEGVVDVDGNWIIELNKKHRIAIQNGYIYLTTVAKQDYNEDDVQEYVYNEHGKLLFEVPLSKWRFKNEDGFVNGLRAVKIQDKTREQPLLGLVNTSGELLFTDKDWLVITPFFHDRAFAQLPNKTWIMIDKKGNQVGNKVFSNLDYKLYERDLTFFQNGSALVMVGDKVALVDASGNYVIEPHVFEGIDEYSFRDIERMGNCIVWNKDISTENDKYSYLYGFWDFKTGTKVAAKYHALNGTDDEQKPIWALQDGQQLYLNRNGQVLWKEKKSLDKKKLDIDFMNRGYHYAASPPKEELQGFGGWGRSKNLYQPIKSTMNFKEDKLSLVIANKPAAWAKEYFGKKLYLANNSSDTFFFDAQDSRLSLMIQAKDVTGEWRNIEYTPSSWCGNSYHQIFLAPKYYWKFVMPQYTGAFKTKLRAVVVYKMDHEDEEDKVLQSNEIEGSVNPAQFWRRRPYYSLGLMDPYDE